MSQTSSCRVMPSQALAMNGMDHYSTPTNLASFSLSPGWSLPKRVATIPCGGRGATRRLSHNYHKGWSRQSLYWLFAIDERKFRVAQALIPHQPAAVVHPAADCGQRHPLTFLQATLAQRLNQRRRYAGIGEIAVVAEIIHQLLHRRCRPAIIIDEQL